MADSIEGFVPIADMTDEQYQACCYPSAMLRPVELSTGETGRMFHRWTSVKSPLTGTTFKVRGQPTQGSGSLRLAGYQISVNVPTCTIGNNCLLVNGVPAACELSVLMLKIWLLEQGATPAAVDALDFERMRLTMVTPTFLHRFSTQALARAARQDFQACVELRNSEKPRQEKRQKKGFEVGDSEDGTAYVRERTFTLCAYVKDRQLKSRAVFATEMDRRAVFDEAELYLRVESKLNGKWLTENKLDRPDDWRLYGEERAYEKAYAMIRKALRLDEGLRATAPTEEEISGLAAVDQEVLRFHLAGGKAWLHEKILIKTSKLAQQQYFSDMKRRVMVKLKVDLSVGWVQQMRAASGRMDKVLRYPGLFVPPTALEMLVFSQASVKTAAHKLKTLVAQGMPRSLANVVLALHETDTPLITLGELRVSEAARRTLAKYGRQLHQLLRLHTHGVFGDVPLEEVASLKEAAQQGKSVTSRYSIGDKEVLVTTKYRRSKSDSGAAPVTQVMRSDERAP